MRIERIIYDDEHEPVVTMEATTLGGGQAEVNVKNLVTSVSTNGENDQEPIGIEDVLKGIDENIRSRVGRAVLTIQLECQGSKYKNLHAARATNY